MIHKLFSKIQLCRILPLLLLLFFAAPSTSQQLGYHDLKLDNKNKIIPWYSPVENAFDNYLTKCWEWAIGVPKDNHNLPISYLYCAWKPGNPPSIDYAWENDIGEKIPNWVESARLYYQYTGKTDALDYVKGLVDYSLENGQTPSHHAWPDFPVGTSNAGDTKFTGFLGLWNCHVDLAADIGWSLTTMYEIYRLQQYLDKAIHVANVLSAHIVPGSETVSPWPYIVNSLDGSTRSRYAASWDGALLLLDYLINNNYGNVETYKNTKKILKDWLLAYPMKNGKWVDGHSDVFFDGNTNLSTTCASDMCLYILDNPSWSESYHAQATQLTQWTINEFVLPNSSDNLPGIYYGAYVPAEQTVFNYRMGYQTARLGAQYARLFAISGDSAELDKSYRCLAYNTYMMQENGQSSDGPTSTVGWWWSDCYGEAPRMYYHALGVVPEWAPPTENHILYSQSILSQVHYLPTQISYQAQGKGGPEYIRLTYQPQKVLLNGQALEKRTNQQDLTTSGYYIRPIVGGDYYLIVQREAAGEVVISASETPELASIAINTNELSLKKGESMQLQVTHYPALIAKPELTWESDNPAVVSVNQQGMIEALQGGNAKIRVSTRGGLFSECTVSVPVPATSLTIQPASITISKGEVKNLTVSILPTDASNKSIIWSSKNNTIAGVSAKGWVNGESAGTTYIYANLQDGTLRDSCLVEVSGEKQAYSVFTNQLPTSSDNDHEYELGMKFITDKAGLITKIRFYKMSGETGLHVGRIWNEQGEELAKVNFKTETASGWQETLLDEPLSIQANTTYVVSVNANKNYPFTIYGLKDKITNGPLSSVVGVNGLEIKTVGAFPKETWNQSNYFRDVVFAPEISTGGLCLNATGLNIILNPAEGMISIEGKSTTTILIYNLAGVLVNEAKLKANQQPVKLFVGKGIYLVKDSETGEVRKVKL